VAPAYPAPRPSGDERNPGNPLDLDAVLALRVNRSAVERRAATIPTRRTVKKEWAGSVAAPGHHLHGSDDAPGRRHAGERAALCAKARRPIRPDLIDALGVGHLNITVGAVCVYHALRAHGGEGAHRVGHPRRGRLDRFRRAQPFSQRLEEARASVAAGARKSTSSSRGRMS